MLTKLLTMLNESEHPLNCRQIGLRLGVETSAAAGMVETLVQSGRLVEVGPDGGVCTECSTSRQCNLRPNVEKRRYYLAA